MRRIELRRVASGPAGTFGVLMEGGLPFALTLEPPWRENRRDVSSIPAGTYECRGVNSKRFGRTFEVTGVEGRSAILFHAGNAVADTHGCILVGARFAASGPGVGLSREAMEEFRLRLGDAGEFTLEIANL